MIKLKHLIFLVHIFLAYSLFAADGDILFSGFGAKDLNINSNHAKIAPDGKSAQLDTTGRKGWTTCLTIPAGQFKPKGQYTIRFNVEVIGAEDSCYLHFIGRSIHRNDGLDDSFQSNIPPTDGKMPVRVSFTAPDDAADHAIHFIGHDSVKINVDSFTIEEGLGEEFIPIGANKKRYKIDRDTLPTGAKEFDVEQPDNPNGEIVEAKRFGIVPGKQLEVKSIQAAIDYCKEKNAAKLVFEKDAKYYLGNGSINISGMRDFTFEGNNATFIYRKKYGCSFVVSDNERILIQNLNVDWDWDKEPLASIVRVKNVNYSDNPEEFSVDYEFVDYKKHPQHGGYLRAATLSCWDTKESAVGIENGLTLGYEFRTGQDKPKVEWPADNVIRIYGKYKHEIRLQPGQYYRMQHYYYDMNNMTMSSNKHMTLRNFTVWSCTGHAFVMSGTQKYTLFDRVRIIRPEDRPKNVITCTADHLHVARSCGYIKLINCDFSQGADDCINFHDCSSYGKKNSPKSIISRHNYGSDGAIIEFRKSDYSPTGFFSARSHAKKLPDGNYEIFFNSELPDVPRNNFILFDKTYDTRNIIVRDCYFHHNRARGILILARDVTIENCRFKHNEMGAIKIETGYTTNSWCEGFGVENVVIRNNIFDTSNPLDVKTMGYARDIFIGTYLKRDPSREQTTYPILNNILFESNTFKDTFGMVTTMGSAGKVTFLKNTFINETPRNNPLPYRGQFYITHSSDIKIVNNKFLKSPNTPKLGVLIDKESTKNIIVQGNKVVRNIDLGED